MYESFYIDDTGFVFANVKPQSKHIDAYSQIETGKWTQIQFLFNHER